MTTAWKTNAARQLIAVVMRPPIKRPGGRADATHAADHAEGPGTRREVGEQHRREDVDGRDQQRGADAFEDRVAEDQHAEAGRHGAHQRADAVDERDRAGSTACGPTGRSACRRGS